MDLVYSDTPVREKLNVTAKTKKSTLQLAFSPFPAHHVIQFDDLLNLIPMFIELGSCILRVSPSRHINRRTEHPAAAVAMMVTSQRMMATREKPADSRFLKENVLSCHQPFCETYLNTKYQLLLVPGSLKTK